MPDTQPAEQPPGSGSTAEFAVPGPYTAAPTSQQQTLGILALVFGIVGVLLSFVGWGLVFALAAVILGHLALKREPAARGMAITGLVTGYAGLAISVVWGIVLLAAVLIPLFAIGLVAGVGG